MVDLAALSHCQLRAPANFPDKSQAWLLLCGDFFQLLL